MVRTGNVAASGGSSPGLDARRGAAALLLLAALAPATAVAQRTPQPVFTELFAYDPAMPSQLLGRWLISSQLDSKLQPLRVGVVKDPIGKTVGRVTVQEGAGLDGATEAMLQARRYDCDSEGSRAAAVEAESGGVVPSERAEIQVRSDRATGAGELVKFGQPVWYRFSFKGPNTPLIKRNREFVDSSLEERVSSEPVSQKWSIPQGILNGNKRILASIVA